MRAFRVALGFLTILPVAPRQQSERAFVASRAFFSLVGLLLGGVLAGLDLLLRQALPIELVGALLLAALVVTTRALHLEGFMDACDGLLGGHTPEERLKIMRDPHVGAFAVGGGICLVLAKWAGLVALPPSARLAGLLLFPCLSRWGMSAAMAWFPYAREQGLGSAFGAGRGRWQLLVGGAVALGASLLLAGGAGALLLATATALAWLLGRWMSGPLGGLTGDTYGAINELLEVAVLVVATALWATGTLPFPSPLLGGA